MNRYKALVFDVSGTLTYQNGRHGLVTGVLELLLLLKREGYLIALATHLSRSGVDSFISKYALDSIVDASVCLSEAKGKPEPEMLELLSIELDVSVKDMLMIGDSEGDIYMAKNFGCDNCAVLWAGLYMQDIKACEPTFFVHSISELVEILCAK